MFIVTSRHLAVLLCAALVACGCKREKPTPTEPPPAPNSNPKGGHPPETTPSESISPRDIQGKWEVVGFAHRGRQAPPANLAGQQFIFSSDALTMIEAGGSKSDYRVALNLTAEPKTIDATPGLTGMPGNPLRGILRYKSGELTIAMNMKGAGSERPKDFESRFEAPEIMVWVLKRAKS